MRVCLVTSEFPPDVGGAAVAALRIVRSLARAGIEIHVVAPKPPSELDEPILPVSLHNGYRVYRAPADPRTPDDMSAFVDRLDRMVRFDLFHVFFLHMASLCLRVAARGGRPLIASVRGFETLLLEQPGYRQLIAAVLEQATWITHLSTDAFVVLNRIVACSDKASFIPNAVDPEGFGAWKITERNRGVVGTTSTFRAKKMLPLLINAYGSLPRHLRKKLLLVGDAKGATGQRTSQAMHEAIKTGGVENEVEVTGYVSRRVVASRLLDMNVFAMASAQEGLPNAILEAAVSGVPIVSTAVDGIKDVFRHGDSALLIQPGNHGELTAAIRDVLQDDQLAASLSAGARRLAVGLSLDAERDAWLALYKRLVG